MRPLKHPAVYILASRPRRGALYIGVTSDLGQRVWQHRSSVVSGFTSRYQVHRLVYYELYGDMLTAITREKQLKEWRRRWKVELIEERNPNWRDLYPDLV
jgi:putative endonuclease